MCLSYVTKRTIRESKPVATGSSAGARKSLECHLQQEEAIKTAARIILRFPFRTETKREGALLMSQTMDLAGIK